MQKGLISEKEGWVLNIDGHLIKLKCDDQDNNELLFQELNKKINQDLSNGKSVVYDATNLSYKKRKSYLEKLKSECYKECILVATPYEKCLH